MKTKILESIAFIALAVTLGLMFARALLGA